MVAKIYVQEALQRAWGLDKNLGRKFVNPAIGQSSLISQLMYDIFGGEILKTHNNKSWHFYNRIDGELIDFTISEMEKSSEGTYFEDLPSSPDEIQHYYAQEDYSTFLVQFIGAFEYAVRSDTSRQSPQD